ncbi:hypothetical protein GCM10010965_29890 [Caldalkalibacillus thermarum]|uniref:Flp pilus assembly protein CpaB n=1 Tax=Caldalkalibacillus thermarum TaxID=296745 RepID=UPI001668BB18|nr:SAF domain-containing protein [Caldalkalibacillus thermarum]GGK34970.1 hypothetical protein GCM10010965_29890 [Caldalkalibacillus thermarum]
MRIKGIGFILVGIVLAVIAGVVASTTVSKATGDTPVVVAKTDIPAYTQITPEDVMVVYLPANSVAPQAAQSLEQVVDRFTRTMIVAGSQVQRDHLSVEGQNDFASLLTSFGDAELRAFALPSQNPLLRRVQPGNTVDLYTVFETDEAVESVLLAERVLVLGIANPDDPQGIILALTHDQIQTILPVMNQVQITLVPYSAGQDVDLDDQFDSVSNVEEEDVEEHMEGDA